MPHWCCKLSGARSPGPEVEWLGPDGDAVRSVLGDGAVSWALEVGERCADKVAQELPQLAENALQVGALRRATTSTTLRALALVAGIDESGASLSSTAASEIEREFARHGLGLDELLGAIRIGYTALASALLDAAAELVPPADSSDELRRISVLLFELDEGFTGNATTTFLEEQNAQAASDSAARFEAVKSIVEAQPIDAARAERLLAYPLSRPHLAMIAWSDAERATATRDLQKTIEPLLHHWCKPTATLVIPVGSHTLWVWAAVAKTPHRRSAPKLPTIADAHVAVGRIGCGIEGFRTSHLEARAVQRLVRLRTDQPPSTTTHDGIELELLLLSDPDAAQQFVDRQLGPLAADDPRMSELRSTLRNYLDMDHSLAKVAATEHISRNTVTYRVQQALSLCAHPAGSPTNKLRSAITVCDWLNGSTPG